MLTAASKYGSLRTQRACTRKGMLISGEEQNISKLSKRTGMVSKAAADP